MGRVGDMCNTIKIKNTLNERTSNAILVQQCFIFQNVFMFKTIKLSKNVYSNTIKNQSFPKDYLQDMVRVGLEKELERCPRVW